MSRFETMVNTVNDELTDIIKRLYEAHLYDVTKAKLMTAPVQKSVTYASGRVIEHTHHAHPRHTDKLWNLIYADMEWWFNLRPSEKVAHAIGDGEFLAKLSEIGIFSIVEKDGK